MLKKKMDYCLQRGCEKAAAEQEELKIRVSQKRPQNGLSADR